MFKISNKPNLYSFLLKNNNMNNTNKIIYNNSIRLLKKEKIIRNTKKLELFLEKNINLNDKSNIFLFNLSSLIFDFSRKI